MPKISPFVWMNADVEEASNLYLQLLPNSKIVSKQVLPDTPGGVTTVINLEIAGQNLGLMNSGQAPDLTPAISFTISCSSESEVDEIWDKLFTDGKIMMPLDKYPFSDKYGWIQDKFGLSWQVSLAFQSDNTQRITPSLLMVGSNVGLAQNAVDDYTAIFPGSKVSVLSHYGDSAVEPDVPDNINYALLDLSGYQISLMESAADHKFDFTPAVSLVIDCRDQDEVDYFWNKLSADPDNEFCGWLVDKYGVSWQVVPLEFYKLMETASPEFMKKFTEMKKIDLEALRNL